MRSDLVFFSRLCTLLAGYSGRRVVVGPAAFKRIHHEKKKGLLSYGLRGSGESVVARGGGWRDARLDVY